MIDLDVRGIWDTLYAKKDKVKPGKVFTNEEQWVLWKMWDKRTQRDIAEAFKVCRDRVRTEYDFLKQRGGPEGEKPDWM